MRFEWDEAKRVSNLRKHGIDFMDAKYVFESRHIKRKDERFHYGEDRWQAIGTVGDKVFFIVYTIREENIRLISARLANDKEKKILRFAR